MRSALPPLRAIGRWAIEQGLRSVRARGWKRALRRIVKTRRAWCRPWWTVRPKDVPRWVPRNDKPLAFSMLQARLAYAPRPFFGRAILVECEQQEPLAAFLGWDGRLGWRHLLKGRLTHKVVPTSHAGLVRKPYLSLLARDLLELLDNPA